MNLDSISIRNLRCITSPQEFPLSPVTLVLGSNSAGKSSFLRTFPLFRQSIETRTKGPILWYGRFVDFGTFNDALSRDSTASEIEFGFSLTIPKNWSEEDRPRFPFAPKLITLEDITATVKLVISEDSETANTYTKKVKLEVENTSIELEADAEGSVVSYKINGKPITSSTVRMSISSSSSFFSIDLKSIDKSSTKNSVESTFYLIRPANLFLEELINQVDNLFHGATSREKKINFIRHLGIGSESSLIAQIKHLARITPTSRSRSKSKRPGTIWSSKLQELIIADRAPLLLNAIDAFLVSTFQHVSYIGPLRATAERFYRQQDLAVDEVDPQGANLAMFLMSLNESERQEFSDWCKDRIGLRVEANPEGAHVSINLQAPDQLSVFNIADMGFGYSQLLPVLATIWRSSNNPGKSRVNRFAGSSKILRAKFDLSFSPKIIAIEQPELHLHPNLQGRFADLLCNVANASKLEDKRTAIVCETHSETIVNRVGKLIAKGAIESRDVGVFVFEKISESATTHVRHARYDYDGILMNWPYGFFLSGEE